MLNEGAINNLYYELKPVIPRRVQLIIRSLRARRQRARDRTCWPIGEAANNPGPEWPGWPEGKQFAVVLTHDVETEGGLSRCEQLADLEEDLGFRSAFGFVPLLYDTPEKLRCSLRDRGFEIFVHGLYHDGKLYRSRRTFDQRVGRINRFLRDWGTRGFASPSSLHNLPWISELDIDYDMSTYDADPFEPQTCRLGQIHPFWVGPPNESGPRYVELPYTLPQDFTLFVLLREHSDSIWRQKLDWIAEKGGMALMKTHPDYMCFARGDRGPDQYPAEHYRRFLGYVRSRYSDSAWFASPSDVAEYWRELSGDSPSEMSVSDPHALCPSCRQALTAGWLKNFRPRPRRAESRSIIRSNPPS